MKKTLILLLLMPLTALAETFQSGSLYYETNSDGRTVTVVAAPNGNKYSGNIVITSQVNHGSTTWTVTDIGERAFQECTGLTSITFPASIKNIGEFAFDSCTGLISISFPEGIETIGKFAFRHCTGLTSVTIPKSVTSIGTDAFAHDHYGFLERVTINSNAVVSNTKIEVTLPDIFDISVEEYVLGNDVTSIGDYAFYCSYSYFPQLSSVVIPNTVTSIGECAFKGCLYLTSLTIPGSVKSIGKQAFSSCGITSLTIPGSVESIGDFAFQYSNLTSIMIPHNVKSLGLGAFDNCI